MVAKKSASTPRGTKRRESPEILTKPLPQILDEMQEHIAAAAEAARRAELAAKAARDAAGSATKASADAEKRGLKNGEVVRAFNDRGSVLLGLQVTNRVPPGTVISYESCAVYDPIEKGKAGSIDRGGCVNLMTNHRWMSKNAHAMAPNSCLIEVEKHKL